MPPIPVAKVTAGYKPQSEDTSIDADVLMFQLLRLLTPQQKAQRFISFNLAVRQMAISGILNQYPGATSTQIRQEFIRRRLGAEWIDILCRHNNLGELVIVDPIGLARIIADILEPLNIPYVVGGSVASSLLGESRATQDLDLVISIETSQVQQLIKVMSDQFYISESAVSEAVNQKASFNVIYLPSMEKADIFVMADDPFSRSKMSRRQLHVSGDESGSGIYIYSAEDIILQKLSWYRLSRRETAHQWRDVLGVMKVQASRLDFDYLTQWADTLSLTELLTQALQQSGL